MRHDDGGPTFFEDVFDRWQRTLNSGVIRYFKIIVEWNIKVDTE